MNIRRLTLEGVMPPTMMSMPLGSGVHKHHQQMRMNHPAATPSDDEVRSATNNIVSAAMAALRPNANNLQPAALSSPAQRPQQRSSLQRSRRHTVDALPSNSSSSSTSKLDVMTDLFLERSMARLQSRPAIMGPRRHTVTSLPPGTNMRQLLFGGDANNNSGVGNRQSLFASVRAEVEAQTQATLVASSRGQQGRPQIQRRVSLLGHLGGM